MQDIREASDRACVALTTGEDPRVKLGLLPQQDWADHESYWEQCRLRPGSPGGGGGYGTYDPVPEHAPDWPDDGPPYKGYGAYDPRPEPVKDGPPKEKGKTKSAGFETERYAAEFIRKKISF